MRAIAVLVCISLVAGCGGTAPRSRDLGSIAIVPSMYEPAAQIDPSSRGSVAEGAVVGAAGGAGIGAMSAKASAGLLCTIGGPLCLIVMIPAAIVGGLVGGVAGAAVDAITTDPGHRIADARALIEQAVADMRLTDAIAAKTHALAAAANRPVKLEPRMENVQPLAAQGLATALEVGIAELEILPREKEMALVLRARSRLYRTLDGTLLDERTSEAQTDFRKYQDWAADEAQALRRAIDDAIDELGRRVVSAHLGAPPRADSAARRRG